MGINLVVASGRLGKDPEVRYTQGGTAVGSFSLAVSERVKSGDEWKEHTEWMNIVAFGKTAENISQYLSKGDGAIITGRLRSSSYEDKNGEKRYKTEIIADKVEFGARKDKDREPAADSGKKGKPKASPEDDEDIPF